MSRAVFGKRILLASASLCALAQPPRAAALPTLDFSRVPGVVIDHSPAASRRYVGSPSLAVLPDGSYVASHDWFGPGTPNNQTVVFASHDRGRSWIRLTELEGQWWSSLFVHRGALYLMGTSGENGFCVIRRSTDEGKTWTVPRDASSGLLIADGKYHCAPVPVVIHQGRLWRAMEDAMGPGGWGLHFHAFMMSAPVDADLLHAESWTHSERLGRNGDWLGGKFGGWLEGNAVVTPRGSIVDVLRVDSRPDGGKAAVIDISDDGKHARFDPATGFIDFPGGAKKFTIRFDSVSHHYWSLVNWIPRRDRGPDPSRVRNTLALTASPDLRHWTVRTVVLHHPDPEKHGFQYVDWQFDDDDLIAVSRTAFDDGLGGAHTQHDANFLTFHRIHRFRSLGVADSLPLIGDRRAQLISGWHFIGAGRTIACSHERFSTDSSPQTGMSTTRGWLNGAWPRRVSLALAVVGIALLGCPTPTSAADQPNILWLVSEDNNPFLGCYGDPLAHTPTLDRLAKEGVLFEHCYAMPVCAPSRFTLITGMYPVSCGPAEHMRAQGRIPSWLKGFPALLRAAGYYTSNNAKTDYNAPIDLRETWNESDNRAHWRGRPNPTQPFFAVFNHEVTHESCLFPARDRPLTLPPTDPARIRIPPYQPDTPEMRADWARYYDHMAVMDAQIAVKLEALRLDGLADNTIVFYYADNGGVLPRSKRFLELSGIHVPLIVYFPPRWRHLAPAPPGSRISAPVHFVDFAPTVLALAGVRVPDYMQGRAFAPTTKVRTNEFVVCTRDRMDEFYDLRRAVTDGQWLYIRNFRPDLPYVQPLNYMFRARGYQSWAQVARAGRLTSATSMFWGEKPAEELYDLAADPDNVHNLAAATAHHETLQRFRAALRRWVIDTNDNGFLPEGSRAEGYDASRVPGAFPVGRAFDLAILASARDPGNLAALVAALEDPNEAIRWWGAQGCAMLRRQAAAAEPELRKRLDDPSGAVAVAAAEALARLGRTDAALPALERWLTAPAAGAFALQAANVLDRLGESARPELSTMKSAMAASRGPYGDYIQRVLEHTTAVLEGRQSPLVYP